MRTGIFALVVGLLVLRFLPALPPLWLLAVLPVAGLMLLPFRSYPIALFLFGFTWACVSAQSALDDRLAQQLDSRTLWLQGQVVGLPEVGEGVVRFQLEQVVSRRDRLPARLRLAWYGGPAVRAGETWRLAVRLKRRHGLVNPQAFDYEAWLLAQRIGATGTVKSGELIAPASGTGAWRDRLRQQLLATPAHGREGALAALVLGDDSGLSTADWQVLQNTGTVHLMVISGQHIGLLAALLYGLVASLARLGLWPRSWPWLPSACLLAFFGALAYGLLAGFEVPVQRACVMIGLVLLWRWRFRHLGVWLPVLVGLLVVPLALLGTLLLPVPVVGAALLWVAGWVLDLLFELLTQLALWLPAWLPSALPFWAWLMVALGALVLLLPAAFPMRSLGTLLLLPLLFSPQQRPEYGRAEVWMLDVGQGLAVLVRTQGHDLLYDAGPRFGEFDTGERVVLPSLRALDVRGLDLLLISHSDSDHAGGAAAIQRGLPVRQVLSGEADKLAPSLQAQACASDQHWQWDGVQFSTWRWDGASDGNQASCVLRIEANGERLWLTGDIDSHAERALLNSGLVMPAEWLLAPHHGSRSSSSAAFLEKVRPTAALVSRGAHNAFGHPHAEVIERYRTLEARLYDTVEQGAVRIRLGAFEPAQGLRYRARFWREK